jgi:hypothetical protein
MLVEQVRRKGRRRCRRIAELAPPRGEWSGRDLGVPSARAASGGIRCRPHRHPAWGPQHRRRLDPGTQRRSAVGVGHAECLSSGCWALRPARKWGCRIGTGRRWRCGPAARRGQAAPSRVSLAGGPARWHREVRRSNGAAGLGAQRTRGGRRRRQTAAHNRWGSGRRRAKTIVPTPLSSWPWRSVWEPGSVNARQA